jgi:DNA-binding IclR family transcriptional regulator
MKKIRPDDSRSLGRALTLFRRIAEDRGRTPFVIQSQELGLSTSTAHRLAAELLRHGLICRVGRGRYDVGLAAMEIARGQGVNGILARAARPLLRQVSKKTGLTAHLGVLEDGMVTYLVKSTGPGSDSARFTKEGMQLEAYCSAVGKVLLASLSAYELDAYLADGEFVSATPRTVTSAAALRRELKQVQRSGMAIDDREIAEDMMCVAVPVCDDAGRVVAALSVSMTWSEHSEKRISELSAHLTRVSTQVSRNLGLKSHSP